MQFQYYEERFFYAIHNTTLTDNELNELKELINEDLSRLEEDDYYFLTKSILNKNFKLFKMLIEFEIDEMERLRLFVLATQFQLYDFSKLLYRKQYRDMCFENVLLYENILLFFDTHTD